MLSDGAVDVVRDRILHASTRTWQSFPWRRRIPFWQRLIAEVLLQRTRASQVSPVFMKLIRTYPTACAFGSSNLDEVRDLIRPLGLPARVDRFHLLAREIGNRHGRMPKSQAELEKLPGVGPYAAAAALSFHGTRRALLVDTNVVRLLCRLTGNDFDGETRRQAWLIQLVDSITPGEGYREFNYAILDLSMTFCRPRRPRCEDCPLRDLCQFRKASFDHSPPDTIGFIASPRNAS